MDSVTSSSNSVQKKRKSRKRKSCNLYDHFEELKDESGKTVGLQCNNCATVLTYVANFNMERHLKGLHKQLASELGLLQEPPRKLIKITVLVDKEEFLKHNVELVTVCHYPLNLYTKKPFRAIVDLIAKKLPIPALTPTYIASLCFEVEKTFINVIRSEVDGSLISLKLDLATRNGRSMLGVNIQFIHEAKIVIRTLGIIETTDRHTAKYIEKEINQLLDKFGIRTTQLYSTTTDSGSNVLKCVKLMIQGQELEFHEQNEEIIPPEAPAEEDDDTDEIPEHVSEDLLIELDSILRSIRCGAHSLNLVVMEAISEENTDAIIREVRDLVKILRNEPFKQSFKTNKKKLPFLDCTTRWGFTYLMMDCIIQNEQFINEILPENQSQRYDTDFWKDCHEIRDTLHPVYVVTKKVQDHAIVYGDFFIMWKELALELSEFESELSAHLIAAMEKREDHCFDNDAFLAASIFDRRISYNGTIFLSEDQQKSGMEHILKTWQVLTGMRSENTVSSTPNTQILPSQTSTKLSRLEQMIQSNVQPKASSSCDEIASQLRKLTTMDRLPLDSNVLNWWEENKHDYPDLYRLATIALAAPCTQVSVERAFSGFGQVLTPARTKLQKKKLETLLFLKLNSDLFSTNIVTFEDQQQQQR